MEGPSDRQRMDTLEKKMDEGFARIDEKMDRGFSEMRMQVQSSERALRGEIAEVRVEVAAVRGDARSDFRTLIGVVVVMWVATLLAVVGHLPIHL
jgi:hypothetical protein